jgi:hypothetical protein
MGCGVACIAGTVGCSLQSHAAHTAALWLGMQHSSAYRCSAFGMWDKACRPRAGTCAGMQIIPHAGNW